MPPTNGRADRGARTTPASIGLDKEVRLLPGGEATLLNISSSGAQIEGKSRLVVGSKVSIRLQGGAVKRMDGVIVRSQVSTIHRDGSLSYESAVDFERPYPINGPLDGDVPAIPLQAIPTPAPPPGAEEALALGVDNDW
jgi:predicted component of type VI protein secretion system